MFSWLQSSWQSVALLLISPTIPSTPNTSWKVVHAWQNEDTKLVFAAESETIVEECRKHAESFLVSPILIQGGHQFFIDGKLVYSTVDRDFKVASNFYNAARVPCSLLSEGKLVRWEAFTQTHALAKIRDFPSLDGKLFGSFLRHTSNVFTAGTLLGLGIICFILFYGKVDRRITYAFLGTCLFYGVTFMSYVPSAFVLEISQSTLQRLSDTCLWLGLAFVSRLFYLIGYSTHRMAVACAGACTVGIASAVLSENLDQSQVGQVVPFIFGNIFLLNNLRSTSFLSHATRFEQRKAILKTISILVFFFSSLNDTLMFQAGLDSEPLFPFGILACVVLLALAVNDRVVEAYEERDFLRQNLEKEVEKKTSELTETLQTLKSTQADLVQSAKLASLGTLSAGIAHEINNALNYVNGSIGPLENLLKKDPMGEPEKAKAGKLLKLMKEGLDLTFGIIVNLKRHTSGSVGQIESISLLEITNGAILLLKSKLSDFKVEVHIPESVTVNATQVGLSQVLLNLIGNAIDAVNERCVRDGAPPKYIRISTTQIEGDTHLIIEDSGTGIPDQVRDRIFDPFFSTKGVGKGTGLGLHIVLSEMSKFNGRVEVGASTLGGARFSLMFSQRNEAGSVPLVGAA